MYEPDRMRMDKGADLTMTPPRRNADRPDGPRPLATRLRAGAAVCAFTLSLFAPVTIDISTGTVAANAAFAGAGDGNFGQGKGNGGPNNQNPGNGGNGNGGGNGDGGDGDNGGGDGGDGGDPPPGNPDTPPAFVTDEPGSGGTSDEADFGEAMDEATGSPAEGPAATGTTSAMPTVSEIFSMGDEAVVSRETELELIANGWNSAN
jgi:hypothetical protein